MMKFIFDAGHGYNTAGKRTPDGSMREWEFNNAVASLIEQEMSNYEGVETKRADDVTGKVDVPLKTRTDKANSWGADVYVSIHANAFGSGGWNTARGIETFVYKTNPAIARNLANLVQKKLVEKTGLYNRGVKTANFHVLRETKMTAILVECGFMTNKDEAELLKSDSYRKKCAKAIVEGLIEFYNLKPKQVQKPLKNDSVSSWAREGYEFVKEFNISDGARPKDLVTREEIWTMLKRLYDLKK